MSESEGWYKRRRYLHFDLPISEKAATVIAGNPEIVRRHAFYPFIRFAVKSHKIKWDKTVKEGLQKSWR
jgi:hypothetical protein